MGRKRIADMTEEEREASRAYQRAYKDAHRDELNALARRDYDANREKVLAKQRARYGAQSSSICERAKYAKNLESEREYLRNYYRKNRDKILEQRRAAERKDTVVAWKNANKEVISAKRIKRLYGLTADAYKALNDAQGGRCAICLCKSKRKLHVDHDHKTGKVRALLCDQCNRGIGCLRDSPDRCRAAARYLELHGVKSPAHETLPLFAGGQK